MSASSRIEAPRLWLVLARCHRTLNQIAERSIEEAGLCLTDFAALEALLHKGPLTITEIHTKVPLDFFKGIAKSGDRLVSVIDLAACMSAEDYSTVSHERKTA